VKENGKLIITYQQRTSYHLR